MYRRTVSSLSTSLQQLPTNMLETDFKKIQKKKIRARLLEQYHKSYLKHSNEKRKITSNNKSN